MNKKIILTVALSATVIASLLFTGCGKDEAAGGTIGAASGAMLGAAVAGRHSKGEGAALGGIAGYLLGSSMGRASDKGREKKQTKQEIETLKAQNRSLQHQMTKWCIDCNRQVQIRTAQSCPGCGGRLIQEKYCDRCKTVFSPDSGYKYCPYCKARVELQGR